MTQDTASLPNEFDHFVTAQAQVYDQVFRELAAGQKRSHWMWFIFPQLRGLGESSMSYRYGIESLAQARRYLAHPVVGPRLRHCTELTLRFSHRDAEEIFGYVDAMKFHSSMTLFSFCAEPDSPFAQAIAKFFGGRLDDNTLESLDEDPVS